MLLRLLAPTASKVPGMKHCAILAPKVYLFSDCLAYGRELMNTFSGAIHSHSHSHSPSHSRPHTLTLTLALVLTPSHSHSHSHPQTRTHASMLIHPTSLLKRSPPTSPPPFLSHYHLHYHHRSVTTSTTSHHHTSPPPPPPPVHPSPSDMVTGSNGLAKEIFSISDQLGVKG